MWATPVNGLVWPCGQPLWTGQRPEAWTRLFLCVVFSWRSHSSILRLTTSHLSSGSAARGLTEQGKGIMGILRATTTTKKKAKKKTKKKQNKKQTKKINEAKTQLNEIRLCSWKKLIQSTSKKQITSPCIKPLGLSLLK